MPRIRKVGLDIPQDRLTRYLRMLIARDPLTHEFLRFPDFDKLYSPGDSQRAWEGYWEHQSKLDEKWGVDVRPFTAFEQVPETFREEALSALDGGWPPRNTNNFERYRELLFSKGVRPTHVAVSEPFPVLCYTFNRGCVGRELARNWCESSKPGTLPGFLERGGRGCPQYQWPMGELSHTFQCFGAYGGPLDQIHTVNIEVSLDAITHRSLQDLAAEMTKILRAALRYAASKRETPEELDFLRTITPRAFTLALRAYDLHMVEGLGFAKIARKLKDDYGIRRSAQSVEEYVKKLHRAIYRAPYTAKRRRIDTPAQGVPVYDCPDHQRNCPKTCQHMKQWLNKIDKMLPTDFTGAEWPR